VRGGQAVMLGQPAESFYGQAESRQVRRDLALATPDRAQPASFVYAPRGGSTGSGAAPRIGLVVPGPPASQGGFPSTVFGQTQDLGFIRVAQFFYVPAIVLTDGRVFANFNGSYEQVLRPCPTTLGALPPEFTTSVCWMIDSYGRYVVVQPR
jgi:hypothetical protein